MNIVYYISNNINSLEFGLDLDDAEFLMVFVIDGKLEIKVDSSVIEINGGTVLFDYAEKYKSLTFQDDLNREAQYFFIFFIPDEKVRSIVKSLVESGIKTLKPGLGFTRDQLERRLSSGSSAMIASTEYYFLSFIYDFSDSGMVKSSSAVMDRHLKNAIIYMKSHLNSMVTLESITGAINISKTHLVRIFRKELGTSPIRFFTSLRIEESARLLSGTNMTLDQVAEKLDFYSDSHFSKVFKKNMGENPSAYRHNYIDSLLSKQKKSFEELEKSYLFIQQLIDATDDLIFYKNAYGRYLGCNTAFCRFVGLTNEEIVGKTDFEIFQKEVAEDFTKHDKTVLSEMKTHRNEEWIQYKDCSRFLVDVSKSPFWGLRGEIGGIIGISRDVTDRRMAEDKLIIAKQDVEKSRKDNVDETLSFIRAESRSLNSLSSYITMLQMSEEDPEKSFIIEQVIKDADSMQNLANTFTGIREIENSTYKVKGGLFSLNELISDIGNFFSIKFPHLSASIETDMTAPLFLSGPRDALTTAIYNIIRHISSSGAEHVDVQFAYKPEKLCVSLTDNGGPLLGNRTSPFNIDNKEVVHDKRGWDLNLCFCQDLIEYIGGDWNVFNNSDGVLVTIAVPAGRRAL